MIEENSASNNIDSNQITKSDLEPIKSLVKDKTSKKLSKGLKPKVKQASWWIRSRRKSLIKDIQSALKEYDIEKAWAHNHFITAEEKKSKNITIYVEFFETRDELDVHKIDLEIDKKFKHKKLNIIDVSTLQPAIKEFVFRDVSPIL